jgi:hypothetical protein
MLRPAAQTVFSWRLTDYRKTGNQDCRCLCCKSNEFFFCKTPDMSTNDDGLKRNVTGLLITQPWNGAGLSRWMMNYKECEWIAVAQVYNILPRSKKWLQSQILTKNILIIEQCANLCTICSIPKWWLGKNVEYLSVTLCKSHFSGLQMHPIHFILCNVVTHWWKQQ